MNKKFKIKKGDDVIVLAGKDKGKKGKVIKMIPKKAISNKIHWIIDIFSLRRKTPTKLVNKGVKYINVEAVARGISWRITK